MPLSTIVVNSGKYLWETSRGFPESPIRVAMTSKVLELILNYPYGCIIFVDMARVSGLSQNDDSLDIL